MSVNQLKSPLSRREFLKSSACMAGFSILPSGILANSSNGKLQIAQIGVGGRGVPNLNALLRQVNAEVVAICDVDSERLAAAKELVPGAKTFVDYRDLLDKLDKKIDAVLVSTPDHMHYQISMDAMEQGKHVYCEKPLALTVVENRKLRAFSERSGLKTQMGIQLASSIGQRMTIEYLRAGLIGKVMEVHVWSNKKWGRDEIDMPTTPSPVPESLDWNLWLGIAEQRPYIEGYYHPNEWRRMIGFGTGTLGDMGVHIFDTPYRALELTAPLWVKTSCRKPNGFAHPTNMKVEYAFAPTKYTSKSLSWTWYDGDRIPQAQDFGITLDEGEEMPKQGCFMKGEKGDLLMPHGGAPRTYPRELIRSIPKPVLKPIDHHGEWVNACLDDAETRSSFSYGAPLSEALQLGMVASRFPGLKLKWDPEAMRVTNWTMANGLLGRDYRSF
jgi:predicted dehydrogenase